MKNSKFLVFIIVSLISMSFIAFALIRSLFLPDTSPLEASVIDFEGAIAEVDPIPIEDEMIVKTYHTTSSAGSAYDYGQISYIAKDWEYWITRQSPRQFYGVEFSQFRSSQQAEEAYEIMIRYYKEEDKKIEFKIDNPLIDRQSAQCTGDSYADELRYCNYVVQVGTMLMRIRAVTEQNRIVIFDLKQLHSFAKANFDSMILHIIHLRPTE